MFGQPVGTLSRWTMLSVVLVVAIVLAGVVLTILILTGDEDSAADPSAGDPTATSSNESVCGLDDEESQDPPTSPPAVDEWGGNGRLPAPMSDEYGPGREQSGVHSCFSNGPKGALFAAVNVLADATNPTVDAEDLRARVLNAEESSGLLEGGSGVEFKLEGFRFINFDPGKSAAVRLAFSTETGSGRGLAAITYQWRWSGGDWKLVAPRNGAPPAQQIPGLDGYTRWDTSA